MRRCRHYTPRASPEAMSKTYNRSADIKPPPLDTSRAKPKILNPHPFSQRVFVLWGFRELATRPLLPPKSTETGAHTVSLTLLQQGKPAGSGPPPQDSDTGLLSSSWKRVYSGGSRSETRRPAPRLWGRTWRPLSVSLAVREGAGP